MRVRVDAGADAVYLNLTDRPIQESEEVADGIVVVADGIVANGTVANGTVANCTVANCTVANGTLANGTLANGTRR